MPKALGQQIVIENIGGAGGMIAAARRPRRRPTATPSCCTRSALAAGMTLYPKLTFDAEKDFVPDRPRQHRASTDRGAPDPAGEQFRGTGCAG